jgi:putative acetyltransferase
MAKVRKFNTKDGEGVKELILSILTKEYPFDKSAYEDSDISNISGVYGGKRCAFYVIEDGEKIVGTVGIKDDTKETALLRRMFVDAGHRKKGYGSLLLKKAIEFCRKNDYTEMVFRATDRMKDAMKLIRKFGFEEVESLPISGFHIHKFLLKL